MTMARSNITVEPVRPSPLHTRIAEANLGNRWSNMNGVAIALSTSGQGVERHALACDAGLADMSATARYRIDGEAARDLCGRLFARSVAGLGTGHAQFNFWCDGEGRVRGFGWLACLAATDFLLIADTADTTWFSDAAEGIDATISDITEDTALIWIEGPKAADLIAAAGVNDVPHPGEVRASQWRGVEYAALRSRGPRGIGIVTPAADAGVLWDRLARAGRNLSVIPVGLAALDAARIARGDVSLRSEADGNIARMAPSTLGLDHLLPVRGSHFNGKRAMARLSPDKSRLVQLEIDGTVDDPRLVALEERGETVGFLTSAIADGFAPSTLALAHLRADLAEVGRTLTARIGRLERGRLIPTLVTARVRLVPRAPRAAA